MLKEGRSSKVFGSLFRSAAEILGHGAVPPGETLIFHIKSSALSIMRARCSGASILQKISGGNILLVVVSLVAQPVESIIEIFRTRLRSSARNLHGIELVKERKRLVILNACMFLVSAPIQCIGLQNSLK